MATTANLYATRVGLRSLHADSVQAITSDIATVADSGSVTATAHGFNLPARKGDVFMLTAKTGSLRWAVGSTEAAAEAAANASLGPVLLEGNAIPIAMREGEYLAIIEAA